MSFGFPEGFWCLLNAFMVSPMGSGFPPAFLGFPSLLGFPQLMRTAALDPRRNFLFAFHPHGVLAAGAFANFCTEATGFGVLFPGLRPHLLTLPCWFRLPLWREYVMCGGLVSSERSSLEFLLSRPGGGHVAVIAVGGPPESLDAHPGGLRLQLLGRKGFVRIALQHGYGAPTP
ncbi:2-acylglycerol O-acyltransferase 2-B-like [Phasianus colchicus]|uniref:2-acylglycerol O-acyltransferase 2-B-like n=1 Tax=Phasianus colchicus TaxID=9054 RepID=UPI00129DC175|nr:2-acylglycerol O-acyltransferase 2-B-like [Phasianus colchicus]